MIIGVPKEIKNNEKRVGLIPSSVLELTKSGHKVIVETNAGIGIDASDYDYRESGAEISTSKEIFAKSDLIIKVKEPQKNEWEQLSSNQILFTYLHLAADINQALGLIKSGCTAIAYETITDEDGGLPLLTPMSEVAGRLSILESSYHLKSPNGGKGLLVSGVPSTDPANILILGGGVVGSNAARLALGLGARVTIIDKSVSKLRYLSEIFGNSIVTKFSTKKAIREHLVNSDVVVGAVLLPGDTAPKLISKDDLKLIKKGSVLVDVAIDQGGCFETSKPTTHENPTYEIDGIIHYCVSNMPGAVPKTSSEALNNVTLPYVMRLANDGIPILKKDKNFGNGLNVYNGKIICKSVKNALNL